MLRQFEVMPSYWANAPYEVDFVIQRENDIIPVEAKAGTNVKATSIKNYEKQYTEETSLIVRLSLRNLSLDGKVLNVPLFMADNLDKIIGGVTSFTHIIIFMNNIPWDSDGAEYAENLENKGFQRFVVWVRKTLAFSLSVAKAPVRVTSKILKRTQFALGFLLFGDSYGNVDEFVV